MGKFFIKVGDCWCATTQETEVFQYFCQGQNSKKYDINVLYEIYGCSLVIKSVQKSWSIITYQIFMFQIAMFVFLP